MKVKLFVHLFFILASFASLAQVNLGIYPLATASGTDTYTATVTPAFPAYTSGQRFNIKFTNANTGAATININSKGAKSIVKNGATALSSGDISAGQILFLQYDGTNMQIVGGGGSGGGGAWGTITGTLSDQADLNTTLAGKETKVFYNVKDYGAVGDGVADDTDEIIAAIAAAPAGGTVFFPVGTYLVSAQLTVGKVLNILGEGVQSIIKTTSGTLGVLNFNNTTSPFWSVTVRKLKILNSSVSNPTAGYGLKMTYVGRTTIEDIEVEGFYDNVIIDNSFLINMTNCSITSYVRYGISRSNPDPLYHDYGDDFYYGLTFVLHRNAPTAISFNQVSVAGTRLTSCKFNQGNYRAQNHVVATTLAGAASYDFLISNCSFENTSATMVIINGTGGVIDDVSITGNQFNGINGTSPSLAITALNNVSLVGNTFRHGGTGSASAVIVTSVNNLFVANQYDSDFTTPLSIGGSSANLQGFVGGEIRGPYVAANGGQPIRLKSVFTNSQGQQQLGVDFRGSFSGTLATSSGRQAYVYDEQALKMRWAIDQNGDMWVGESSSVYGMRVTQTGNFYLNRTITAGGTTGAQTINKPSGTVNFAAGATSLVVTNSLVTTSSIVFATIRTNDATAVIKNVVPASGSFTITLEAATTAETSVGFFVTN